MDDKRDEVTETEKTGRKSGHGGKKRDDTEKARLLRLVLTVIAAVFALGAAACLICYVMLKNDILFIPFALSIVVAMILFTYARVK